MTEDTPGAGRIPRPGAGFLYARTFAVAAPARLVDLGQLVFLAAGTLLNYPDEAMTIKRGAITSGEWGIIVHGGAGIIAQPGPHEAGCRVAAERGAAVLAAGGSAMDATEAAVHILEDDPVYNAGTGGSITADGEMSFDAAMMDGATLRAGAVCALGPFKNPIHIARAVEKHGRHVLYAGRGADEFALGEGFSMVDPESLKTDRSRANLQRVLTAGEGAKSWAGGTVGAVARDRNGDVAAATSTGGTMGKRRGRVGDSPLLGAGTYADNSRGAISATGEGEGIMRVCLSYAVLEAIHAGANADEAAERCLREMGERVLATGGVIIALPGGGVAWARSTPAMSWAAVSDSGDMASGI